MAIGRMAKYNDVGAGAKPILNNTSMLYNGPARPGGSQKATVGLGKAKSSETTPRSTPKNQHGVTGKVEPASKQPDSAVR
jgi:hypothetical protein